jgi:hypothetical protein
MNWKESEIHVSCRSQIWVMAWGVSGENELKEREREKHLNQKAGVPVKI